MSNKTITNTYDYYHAEISAWDWDKIVLNAKNNTEEDEDGYVIGWAYLGSILYLTPSGKYYTPWANSNVTEKEAQQDELWQNALEDVASNHGGYVESGDGDPLDLFFCIEIGRFDNRIIDLQ